MLKRFTPASFAKSKPFAFGINAEMYLKGIVNIPMAERAFIYVSGKLSGIRRSLIS